MLQAFEEARTIFLLGNGCGAAIASCLMCDFNKTIVEGLEDAVTTVATADCSEAN